MDLPDHGLPLALSLPPSRLPVHAVHPWRDRLRARQARWLRARLGADLGDRVAADGAAVDVMCWKFPHADPDRLFEVCLLVTVFIWLDDMEGDAPDPRLLLAAARGSADAAGPVAAAFAEIVAALRRGGGERMGARLLSGIDECFTAYAAKRDVARRIVGYDGYLAARRDDFAGGVLLWFVEYLYGVDLDEMSAAPADLTPLHAACLENVFLVNDLLSFRKEYLAGETMNAVSVLCGTAGLGTQQAVDVVCRRVAASEAAFLTAADALLADRPALAPYVTGLRTMLAGNWAWMWTAPRYHGPDHEWDGTVPTGMVLHPDRTVFTAAPVVSARVPASRRPQQHGPEREPGTERERHAVRAWPRPRAADQPEHEQHA
jgi:hypothetical protein